MEWTGSVLIPTAKADTALFTEAELDIMDRVCAGMGGYSSRKLSDLSHQEEAWKNYLNNPIHIPFDAAFALNAV